jgi:cytosol alanyl aminopeptidase
VASLLRRLYGARARTVGWRSRPGEGDDERRLRGALLRTVGAGGRDPALQAEAEKLAWKWLDDRKAVEAELVPVVLGVAAQAGDRKLYERLKSDALSATDHRERERLLNALAAFRDPALAGETLTLVTDEKIDLRDSQGILWWIMGNPDTREQGWAFFKENFDKIAARLGGVEAAGVFYVAGMFCDEAHRKDAEAFLTPKTTGIDGATHILTNSLERVDLCIAEWNRNRPIVEKYLRSQK